MYFTLLICVFFQDDQAAQAERWIQQLSSANPDVRERAVSQIKEIGPAALPSLNRAASANDPEVAARAKHLVTVIHIRSTLSSNLLKILPSIDERLAAGDRHTWTALFLELTQQEEGGWKIQNVRRRDKESIISEAIAGANTTDDKLAVLDRIGKERYTSAIDALRKLLVDESVSVRASAACTLAELGDIDSVPELLRLSSNPDPGFRMMGSRGIYALGPKRIISLVKAIESQDSVVKANAMWFLGDPEFRLHAPPIIKQLADGNGRIRKMAAWTLGRMGASEGVPRLIELLNDDDDSVRAAIAKALGELGAIKAIVQLENMLGDSSPMVRANSSWALGHLRSMGSIPKIVRLLDDRETAVVAQSIIALCEMGSKESLPLILPKTRDPDSHIRRAAIEAVGILQAGEAHFSLVIDSLTDKDSEVREAAAEAAGRLGISRAIPLLVSQLDESSVVRVKALSMMVKSHPRESLDALSGVLERELDTTVLEQLLQALNAIDPQLLLSKVIPLLTSSSRSTRENAIVVLGGLKVFGSREALVKCLGDEFAPNRARAIKSLTLVEASADWSKIATLLEDRSPDVRAEALLGLGNLHAKEAAHRIAKSLEDTTDYVRASSAIALGMLADSGVGPALIRALADNSAAVREAAARAIGWNSCSEGVKDLRRLLKDPARKVRKASIISLALLRDNESIQNVVDLLDDVPDVRKVAAAALSILGIREGTRILLEDGSGYFHLNESRDLESSGRLRSALQRVRPAISMQTYLEGLAQEGGWTLEVSQSAEIESDWPRFKQQLEVFGPQWVWEEGFGELSFHLIVGSKQLQVLRPREAQKFWEDWFRSLTPQSSPSVPYK